MSPPWSWGGKYDYLSRFNGNPASGLGVKLASGANEMATAKLVLDRLNELRSTSLTAWNTRSRMKPPPLSKPRLSMWSKRCWKLSRWFSW
ncbi:efflux pump [Salmonella enterica subsp. enterica]|uniref:Efflux pump n=1 Tax=Salmonella enterica I TaxID=59201 RepID=A0A379W5I6_SALET|nr:efflux pump [Salmonella enterica subsp. enterica]